MTKPARTRRSAKAHTQTGYRVYLNKFPHRPKHLGRILFFESPTYEAARHFAEQMVRNSVEWLVEDWEFFQSWKQQHITRLQNFLENFWIEPVGDAPQPEEPFCPRRTAEKILKNHPEILVANRQGFLDAAAKSLQR